jgi:serine/threonine protein kinase/formylglycine-generating enzyme required for sulfatase activity
MSGNTPDLSGRALGNWQLVRRLGEGGFGSVYQAQHRSIPGRQAAVKVLHPHMAWHKDIQRRFVTEASVASQADHENIIQIFDGGVSDDGFCYVAMEFLKGQSLAECLQREGRLSLTRTLDILAQVASALEAAHQMGVVHRDLKPDNIFLIQRKTKSDFVKVLDFGIAKLQSGEKNTQSGMMLGTPIYMSPEQWQTLPDIDGRADLYALGIILFECLTGKAPYDAPTSFALMMAHINGPIPDISKIVPTPPQVCSLLSGLMAKQREHRPPSASWVAQELHRLVGTVGVDPMWAEETQVSVDASAPTIAQPSWSPRPVARSLSLRQHTGELIQRFARQPLYLVSLGAVVLALVIVSFLIGQRAREWNAAEKSAASSADQQGSAAKPDAAAAQARPALPAEMAILGPGQFSMGWGSVGKRSDGPAHPVTVARFALGRQEVSMADYRAYVLAESIPPPLPWDGVDDFASIARLPVNQVTRDEAARYCEWRYRAWNGRLPTEEEWEYAARGGGSSSRYPWPDQSLSPQSGMANVGRKPPMLMPVDALMQGASHQGVQHLIGNVAEWTGSRARSYPGSLATVPREAGVVRGGSAADPAESISATSRSFQPPGQRSPFIGFRCAATPPD